MPCQDAAGCNDNKLAIKSKNQLYPCPCSASAPHDQLGIEAVNWFCVLLYMLNRYYRVYTLDYTLCVSASWP